MEETLPQRINAVLQPLQYQCNQLQHRLTQEETVQSGEGMLLRSLRNQLATLQETQVSERMI